MGRWHVERGKRDMTEGARLRIYRLVRLPSTPRIKALPSWLPAALTIEVIIASTGPARVEARGAGATFGATGAVAVCVARALRSSKADSRLTGVE